MEKNVSSLTEMTHKSSEMLTKSVAKVKEVCSNYF